MSRAAVTIEGLDKLEAELRRVGSKTREGAEQAIAEEAEATRDDARRQAPKGKTGDLRDGIRFEVQGLEATVRATTRYSTFVEHGTYKDKAQPFMAPAAERTRRRLPKRAADIIRVFLESK